MLCNDIEYNNIIQSLILSKYLFNSVDLGLLIINNY